MPDRSGAGSSFRRERRDARKARGREGRAGWENPVEEAGDLVLGGGRLVAVAAHAWRTTTRDEVVRQDSAEKGRGGMPGQAARVSSWALALRRGAWPGLCGRKTVWPRTAKGTQKKKTAATRRLSRASSRTARCSRRSTASSRAPDEAAGTRPSSLAQEVPRPKSVGMRSCSSSLSESPTKNEKVPRAVPAGPAPGGEHRRSCAPAGLEALRKQLRGPEGAARARRRSTRSPARTPRGDLISQIVCSRCAEGAPGLGSPRATSSRSAALGGGGLRLESTSSSRRPDPGHKLRAARLNAAR